MNNLKLGLQIELEGNELVVRQLDGTRSSVKGFGKDVDQSKRSTDGAVKANKDLATSYRTVKASIAALGIGFLIRKYASLSDEYSSLSTRIKTATKDSGGYEQVQRRLLEITKQNGAELRTSVSLFQGLARVAPELNATNKQMLVLTDTVQKLGVIGGSTQAQMNNGLLQFTQGLAGGVFRAEEFNSLLENTPEIAARLGKGLGVSVGQLRKMVIDGKLLSQDVFTALLKQAPEIATEFESIPLTIERGGAKLKTTLLEVIGQLDQASGISSGIAGFLSGAADTLSEMVSGSTIGDLTQQILQLESTLAGLGDGEQKNARRGRRGPNKSALQEKLAELGSELTQLKAKDGDVQSIKKVLAELNAQIEVLDGASTSGQGKRGLRTRIGVLTDLTQVWTDRLKKAEKQIAATNNAADKQTVTLRALTKEELQLVNALLPVQAKQQAIKQQLVELKTAYSETTLGTEKYTAAKAALEKQLHALNNPLEAIVGNLQAETKWLQRELAATLAGKQALRDFNREKAIEAELRSNNAYQLAPAEVDQLRAEIAARYDATTALEGYRDAAEEAEEAQDAANETMEHFVTEIVGSFVDGAGSIGDVFSDLWSRIKREFINSGIASLLNFNGPSTPLLSGVSGLFSSTANAGGSSGGGGFSLGDLLSSGKSLLNLNGSINGAIDGIVNGLFNAGFQDAAVGVGNYAETITSGSGGFGGAAGGVALNLAAGYAGAFAGDKLGGAVFGKTAESNLGATAGALIGSFFGPLGTFAGGALGGLADVAFGGDGKKRVSLGVLTEPGSQAPGHKAFGASGLELTAYTKRAGDDGVALANSLVDAAAYTDSVLTGLYEQLGTAVNLAGRTLDGKAAGAGTDWGQHFFGSAEYNGVNSADVASTLDDFTAAWQAKVEEITGFMVDLSPFEPLIKEGEALADTVGRVQLEFVAVTGALDALGFELLDLSVGGLAAAGGLVQAFGGLEQFSSGVASYYDLFYSAEEKLEKHTVALTKQFSALGVAMPDSRTGFRDLVDGLDLTTSAAQTLFAELVGLAPAFDQYLLGTTQSVAVGLSLVDLSTQALGNYEAERDLVQRAGDERMAALRAEAGAVQRIADSLLGMAAKLKLSNISPLTNTERLALAADNYSSVLQGAQAGDPGAATKLGEAGKAYLTEAASFYASSSEYSDIFNDVTGALDSLGSDFARDADVSAQLAQIQTSTLNATLGLGNTALSQLSQLVAMTAGIDSVAELLAVLPSQLSGSLSAATGVAAADLSADPIFELYNRGLGRTPDAPGYAYWQNQLDSGVALSQIKEAFFYAAELNGAENINQFASGTPFVDRDQTAGIHFGEMIIDRQSSDVLRKYGISVAGTGTDNTELVTELKALRAEVTALRSERAGDAQRARDQRTSQQASTERSGRQAARSKVMVLSWPINTRGAGLLATRWQGIRPRASSEPWVRVFISCPPLPPSSLIT
ncbi:MAG: tape measure protein [Porticoccaceae bacterium]|nr:tape measure protein [Porticoccaceae bacterium]